MLQEWITHCNLFFFKWSKGRLGCQLGPFPVLLLHTKGRKSGKNHITPLAYCRDGDAYLLTASNWGSEKEPDWYLNLRHNPRALIQVESAMIEVDARAALDGDYERMWKLVSSRVFLYPCYQRNLSRRIPVVVLTTAAEARPD